MGQPVWARLWASLCDVSQGGMRTTARFSAHPPGLDCLVWGRKLGPEIKLAAGLQHRSSKLSFTTTNVPRDCSTLLDGSDAHHVQYAAPASIIIVS